VVQSLTTHPENWSADFWQTVQGRLQEKGRYSGAIGGQPNPATLDTLKRSRQELSQPEIERKLPESAVVGSGDLAAASGPDVGPTDCGKRPLE